MTTTEAREMRLPSLPPVQSAERYAFALGMRVGSARTEADALCRILEAHAEYHAKLADRLELDTFITILDSGENLEFVQ